MTMGGQLYFTIYIEFDKSRWFEKDVVIAYLEKADIRIIDRRRLLEILKSFYRHFLGNKQQNKVLDYISVPTLLNLNR